MKIMPMKFSEVLKQAARQQMGKTGAVCLALAFAAYLFTGDWLGFAGIMILWAGWQFLPAIGGPPVLQMAFTYQWVQVFLGVYYHGLTDRKLDAIEFSDYRPMVMIGMGCLMTLLVGLAVGAKLAGRVFKTDNEQIVEAFSLRFLIIAYVVSFVVVGGVTALAWQVPSFTQAILALTLLRLALLFLLLRKLVWPKFQTTWFSLILVAEVAIGLTGFFADFKEPLIVAVVVCLERFEIRKFRHWAALSGLSAAIVFVAVLWTTVKIEYRAKYISEAAFAQSTEARLDYITTALGNFISGQGGEVAEQVDALVDRMWVIYYPALAVARVPHELPHTDGEILRAAMWHVVTPRFLFPEKEGLASDSEMVRKYSGIWVAGGDDGFNTGNDTSIAFGYAAESYIDFGLPWMFVPVLIWGLLMGMAYRMFFKLIVHRELAIAVGTVIFWSCLYLFERSWVKTLGQTATMFGYLTVVAFIVDRFLLSQKTTGSFSGNRTVIDVGRGA